MADKIYDEIVLESANKQIRYKLFVADDGTLAAIRLFQNKDGSWKPKKPNDHKILANYNLDGSRV